MDLELVTTKDLIEELYKRTTFVGVMVYYPNDYRDLDPINELVVKTNCGDSTTEILEKALQTICA